MTWRSSASLVAAGMGMVLASCSEPTTSSAPIRRPSASATSNVVGAFGSPAGSLQNTISSGDALVHYCGYSLLTIPLPGTFSNTDCGAPALNLTAALDIFNPGDPDWSSPFPGTSWIGPTGIDAPSNEYRARVGSYEYVAPFLLPPGATNVSLQLRVKSDNAFVAYLNGTEIGRNQFLQDCTLEQGFFCNWTAGAVINVDDSPAPFNVGGGNLLRFDVVNTRIGQVISGTPRSTCPQALGSYGFQGFTSIQLATFPLHGLLNWNPDTCENPTGIDFQAKVFFTPATPLFVIGDDEPHGVGAIVNFWGAQWWKNNQMTGQTDPGYESFKGYASSADNHCGGVWSTEPGNSSNPPAMIPDNFVIIVTSKVLKNGSTLSGDIKQIVSVHQDGNYEDNPGHAGGGTVTSIVCTQ